MTVRPRLRRSRWFHRFGGDRGTVTAETAVVLPVLVIVVWVAVSAVAVATAQLRCVDGAREGARAAARGEPIEAVRAAAARAGPHRSTVDVKLSPRHVEVTVHATVRPLGGLLPEVRVSGRAAGVAEPGEP